MKFIILYAKISFCIFFVINFSIFSFGQNATNGGEIGIINPDTVYTATYFQGELADTILNFASPSGGNAQLDLEYHWDVGTTPNVSTWTSAPGITNRDYYIPSTDALGTFYYHRDARREGFTLYQAASNIIIIHVVPAPVSTETLIPSIGKIYPNPVTDYLQIEFKENHSSNWQVEIFDIKGSLQKNISLENVNALETINLQDLAKGTYIIQLTDLKNDKMESFKFLKK